MSQQQINDQHQSGIQTGIGRYSGGSQIGYRILREKKRKRTFQAVLEIDPRAKTQAARVKRTRVTLSAVIQGCAVISIGSSFKILL
jgi:hypothetical protein